MKQNNEINHYHKEKKCFISEREEGNYEHLSESFAEFIRRKRKEVYNSSGTKILSIGEHAQRLGLSKDMYQKILNKQKPNQSRDCIIAICATIDLDSEDTDYALHLYDDMPALDKNSKRDHIIMHVLNGGEETIGIETINSLLTKNDCSPLFIISHRGKNRKGFHNTIKNKPYKILRKSVETRTDSIIYDPYNSLSTRYDFTRYHCYAYMWLDDPEKHYVYKLCASHNNYYTMEIVSWSKAPDNVLFGYKTLAETGVFHDYFIELQGMASMELKRMEGYLNDTKNYQERVGANILDGRIHIFYETFNYTVPELNDYYLFEYINGIYRLTVSSESLFMRNYLSPEEYANHYGKVEDLTSIPYDSLEEIEKHLASEKHSQAYDKLLLRRNAYRRIKPKIENYLSQLRNHEIFVRNLKDIWDDVDRVCKFFDVEKDYDCYCEGEYQDFMVAGKKESTFTLADHSLVTISLEDLYRAFELGFSNIDEICKVKAEYGSIDSCLQ